MTARSVGSTIVKMTTARLPVIRATASCRSATVSTRGWRTVRNGWVGNWASVAATTRVAVSPVASETMCTSTTSSSPLTDQTLRRKLLREDRRGDELAARQPGVAGDGADLRVAGPAVERLGRPGRGVEHEQRA